MSAYIDELVAVSDVKNTIIRVLGNTSRISEVFISSRRAKSAGEYTATIIARVLPQEGGNQTLCKELMRLFIQGNEIKFIGSDIVFIAEKSLRAEDFSMEVTISVPYYEGVDNDA